MATTPVLETGGKVTVECDVSYASQKIIVWLKRDGQPDWKISIPVEKAANPQTHYCLSGWRVTARNKSHPEFSSVSLKKTPGQTSLRPRGRLTLFSYVGHKLIVRSLHQKKPLFRVEFYAL
ncbi:MAG: hypothetical protein Q8Q23_05525 [bacterium]|nr:hypothetical protein [bacterium]